MSTGNKRKESDSTFTQSIKARLKIHSRCLADSLTRLKQTPLTTFLSIAVIGITLALPAGLTLLFNNVEKITGNMQSSNTISVYLKHDLDDQQIEQIQKKLKDNNKIAETGFISREQALAEYQQNTEQPQLIEMLGDNPLPAVITVEPKTNVSPEAVKRLAKELEKLDQVDIVQFNSDWAIQIQTIINLLQKFSTILTLLLVTSVLLIIGNTVRANIQNRFQEIQLSRLFGATKAYIRRPFLYSGLLYGFFGGLLASFLLILSYALLAGPFHKLVNLYQLESASHDFFSPFLLHCLITVLVGAILGTISAYIVVYYYQRELESSDFS